MIIQHNMAAMYTGRQFGIINNQNQKFTERLSSGYRINRASDDAAGLMISEKMRGQIRGLSRGAQNCEEGLSLFQTADGAMQEVEEIVQRMRELCVQGANDTYVKEDREAIQEELNELKNEIDRMYQDVEYNTIKIFQNEYDVISTSDFGVAGAQGKVVSAGTVNIDINRTGLALLVGSDKITTSGRLSDTFFMPDTNWTLSGQDHFDHKVEKTTYSLNSQGMIQEQKKSYRPDEDLLLQDIQNRINLPTWVSGQQDMAINYMEGNRSITGTCSYDAGGRLLGATYKVEQDVFGDGNMRVIEEGRIANTAYSHGTDSMLCKEMETYHNELIGTSGVPNRSYLSAYIDFSGAGTEWAIKDLVDLGFNSSCATCSRTYSIKFVKGGCSEQTKSGYLYSSYNSKALNPVIELDVNSFANGADIVKAITEACTGVMDNHYTQYAYDNSNPDVIYIFDNRSDFYGTGREDFTSFEPYSRTTEGIIEIPGQIVKTDLVAGKTTTYNKRKYHLQVGANDHQDIKFNLPFINSSVLGVNSLSVVDYENGTQSITKCDKALDYINHERSYMGALYNRVEHAKANNDNAVENLQSAESLLRDADMAENIMQKAKTEILMQAGISMISQANNMNEGVLALLR